jgi:hypothetical protein
VKWSSLKNKVYFDTICIFCENKEIKINRFLT